MSSSIEIGIDQFSEANNVILMSLMEETHEYEDEYFGDDKLENVNANTCIPCENEMEHVEIKYEDQNFIDDFQMYYGVFMEQQHRETYNLSQISNNAVL
ncbi:unnamed protein product [Vicia faba]|uniref:Uncharacterized protein n=1 Tax=Vicia faba TaxID=3906 RepID=A0AAV0ZC44_VICFA|nr:unnamed protein product [Vicia faba]